MATNTYVALDSQTLASAASSVTFTGISGSYTDLVLVMNVKNTTNGSNCKFQFNSDTGSNYSTTWVEGNGSSASSGRDLSATSGFLYYNGNASTYNWSTVVANFQNYSNTTTYKPVITRFGNGAQTGGYTSTWRNTAAVTSITLNAITQNFQAGSTFALYGVAAASVGAKATGGTIYQDASYFYHVFAGNGTFTPSQSISADVLVVAGGGGGAAGGGGAGGIFYATSQSLTATGYTCTVGAGGNGGSGGNPSGYFSATSGANSSFGSLTAAVGGGYGAMIGNNGQTAGANGGSGGAGGAYSASTTTGGSSTQTGTGGTGYGNAGGGNGGYLGDPYPSGGGGGAGGVGSNATSNSVAGAGGAGLNNWATWLSSIGIGSNGYIAGGGGGGIYNPGGTAGTATAGGGNGSATSYGTAGTANTGGGGGGAVGGSTTNYTGGSGGSGLVIVRYAK